MIVHAGLVARRSAGFWRGLLIEGASGAGKSDLALRLLDAGWRLVADDRVVLWRSGGRAYGRAPSPISGLIEVRGLGVQTCPALPVAEIALVLSHVDHLERMPDPRLSSLVGVALPAVSLNLLHPAAPARVLHAWTAATSDARPHRLDSVAA